MLENPDIEHEICLLFLLAGLQGSKRCKSLIYMISGVLIIPLSFNNYVNKKGVESHMPNA